MGKAWMVPLAALLMGAGATGEQGSPEPLAIRVVRFYSPARGTTTIEGVCELKLAAVAVASAPVARYRVEVSIRDSTGLELQHSDWAREVPAATARTSGATEMETFEFPPAAAGRYQVVVRVVPETGPVVERAVEVSAFAGRPPLSDLVLATAARAAEADTGAVAAGEIRRGSLVMRTAPVPQLSATDATLSYYAEVYPWEGAAPDGQLTVAVLRAGGQSVIRTSPRAVRIPPAGGATEGSLELAGLPPGEYRLELRVRLGDSSVTREAGFVMRPAAAEVASAAPAADSQADRFDGATEAQLDSLYAPLVYLLEPSEQSVYDKLAVEGKRRFLREAWARRDTQHGTGGVNQVEARFYAAVDFANRAFHEGGAGQIPGWRTDRGRVYLKNGQWDEILRRPMASPAPYEVWKYTRGRQRYYVFLDRSGLGVYRLIATNDRHEVGLQGWGQLVGTQDSIDVVRFLGLSTMDETQ
ncbi:MAG TPA: GWxTD domain-containing protein [Gemmatimonadales bacterium]|nr:GWxTD domain-containing protein [Gemmatimonadales bacterium]